MNKTLISFVLFSMVAISISAGVYFSLETEEIKNNDYVEIPKIEIGDIVYSSTPNECFIWQGSWDNMPKVNCSEVLNVLQFEKNEYDVLKWCDSSGCIDPPLFINVLISETEDNDGN